MIHFVTAADHDYFTRVICLIGSIKETHQEFTIDVFNLGFNEEEKRELRRLSFIEYHDTFEITNPQMLTPLPMNDIPDMRKVPGLYSWKPCIIKLMLDKYESILYLDAGITVKKELSSLLEHININGCFLLNICAVAWMTPEYLIDRMNLTAKNLYQPGLNAGIQGLNRKYQQEYVLRMYELSKDITNFYDDGTALGGLGWGRHDQTLWSICAVQAGMKILKGGPGFTINITTGEKYIECCESRDQLTENTLIYHSRGDANYPYYSKLLNINI